MEIVEVLGLVGGITDVVVECLVALDAVGQRTSRGVRPKDSAQMRKLTAEVGL